MTELTLNVNDDASASIERATDRLIDRLIDVMCDECRYGCGGLFVHNTHHIVTSFVVSSALFLFVVRFWRNECSTVFTIVCADDVPRGLVSRVHTVFGTALCTRLRTH